MPDDFLTLTQLVGWLGIRGREITKLVDVGRIPYRRIGKALRFRRSHIEAWLTTLEGMDAVKKLPATFSDPFSATNGNHADPRVHLRRP